MNLKSGHPGAGWVPFACLLVTGALLGVSTNLAKLAGMHGLSALPFLAWSLLGAALILGGTAAVRHRWPPLSRRTAEYFVVSALLSVAGPQLLFFTAIPHVGASFVALAIALPPLFTYLGVLVLGMERFSIGRAAGVAFALAGAGLLAIMKLDTPDAETSWVLATLAGPLLLAAGNIYRSLRWPENTPLDALAPGMLAAAALGLLLVGVVPGFSLAVSFDSAVPVLLIAAQTAAFALQYFLFFILQERGGPVYMSLLGAVGALVGVPVAVLLIGETAPSGLLAGGGLIAVGIFLITSGGTAAAQRKETQPP
ncbi:MAG: DMT family transporter [Chitinophagaceae bacterium]|nr:DMT family transporter [Rubrivivax sp.]